MDFAASSPKEEEGGWSPKAFQSGVRKVCTKKTKCECGGTMVGDLLRLLLVCKMSRSLTVHSSGGRIQDSETCCCGVTSSGRSGARAKVVHTDGNGRSDSLDVGDGLTGAEMERLACSEEHCLGKEIGGGSETPRGEESADAEMTMVVSEEAGRGRSRTWWFHLDKIDR
ncbi:hypothetical protein HDV00_009263 [Rhizophlyctis rosea]|nr:hypothetical protein HDV00_009263 [Rhizophlyctis rosea]